MVEGEARALSSSALTRVFSRLYLEDASFDLSSFLAPVDSASQDPTVAAVKSSIDSMLNRFLVIGPPAEAGGTGNTRGDEAPPAGNGDAQI